MMMGFGFLIFVIVAGVVIAAALGVGKLLLSNNSSLSNIFSTSTRKTSREILEERFVRGEINRKEFELMKAEIE
jgi:uncharacterized membrane protein